MIRKLSFVFIVFTFVSFAFFQYSKSYDDKTTHPGLTDEMVDFYNASFSSKLSAEEKEWIVQGAIDEDIPPRWINHFYDPLSKEGWQAENLGTVSSFTLKFLSNVFFNTNTKIVSSKQWVHDETLQARYANYGGNNTWENGIRQYANGNKKEAYYILGHILHLLEDKTVPDHTRNDTHAHEFSLISKDGGSPYEDYGKNFNRQNLTTAQELQQKGKQPILLSTVDDYFEHLARYSNNYFFSEHTINSEKYANPKIAKENANYGYGKDEDGKEFLLVRVNYSTDEKLNEIKTYTLRDDVRNNLVLSSYFSRLTQEAVMSGAGAMKLFLDEAEKATQNKSIISPEPKVVWWEKMQSPLYGALASYNDAIITTINIYSFATNFVSSFASYIKLLPAQLSGLINTNAQPEGQAVMQTQPQQPTPQLIFQPAPLQILPQGDVVPATNPIAYEVPTAPIMNVTPAQDIAQEVPIVLPAVLPVEIVETSPAEPEVISDVPTYHGSAYVSGVSQDVVIASPTEEQLALLSSSETSTTTDATATSTESTATSTPDTISDTATSMEDVVNTATSTEPVIVAPQEIIDGPPIVINEIAWMGTKAQANDEWIELYNKTSADIDLSGWTLESRNKQLSVSLSGAIPAQGYFLLERTASTTTDQIENMIFTGALNNSGPDANMYLKNGTTTIDFVGYGSNWFAGDNGARRTMERVSPYATSTNSYNWKTYSDALTPPFAKDAKGGDILGTPGAKNSVTGYYMPAGIVTEDTVWRKIYSPYYAPYMLEVKNGATLTIEPGVVVKFAKGAPYGGGMDVYGVLRAEGAIAEPIVFTSFLDDAVDNIDSNQDGSATVPAPADWMNMNFYNTNAPSVVSYAQVRYGGKGMNYNPNGWYPKHTGAFGVYGARPHVADSIFEQNYAVSLYMEKGAHPLLERNTIKNTIFASEASTGMSGYGVRIADASSTADIIGNIFEANAIGISSESATSTPLVIKNNTFTRNQKNGDFNRSYGDLNLENTNNQDSEHKGGFFIYLVARDGQAKTLHADTMPYILSNGIAIIEDGALTIEPGVVIKSPSVPIVVWGVLKAQGTVQQPIIFTALEDNSDGYVSGTGGTVLSPGVWKNIQFIGATSSDSVLEYVNIRYGGSGENLCPHAYFAGPCMEYKGALLIQDASPTISRTTFDKNLATAIYVMGDAQPTIEYSDIRNTKEAMKNPRETIGGIGISIGAESGPMLTDNTFTNNNEDVVYRP